MSEKSIAAAIVLAVLWLCESLVPMYEGRSRRAAHGAANLALGVFNALLTSVLFAGLILFVTEWARARPFGILHWVALPDWLVWQRQSCSSISGNTCGIA